MELYSFLPAKKERMKELNPPENEHDLNAKSEAALAFKMMRITSEIFIMKRLLMNTESGCKQSFSMRASAADMLQYVYTRTYT